MYQILNAGSRVRTQFLGDCTVESYIGGGGQGEVYKAAVNGKSVALKWYYPQSATSDQRSRLEMLIRRGAPTDKFLWPMDLAMASNIPAFGYVMPLRSANFKGIPALLTRRISSSLRALAVVGRELAHSYYQLHARGWCYRDISWGNVFFDPITGDALICDNDNADVDGTSKCQVLGTEGFMAPEVCRGQAQPSKQTDLHSLAVLLFYMFVNHHPLVGRREPSIFDPEARLKLWGTEPLFIFDPKDKSNEPVPGEHVAPLALWPLLPQFLRDLFTQAFTRGLPDPHGRVVETIWRKAMIRLGDSVVYCFKCGMQTFADPGKDASNPMAPDCWKCREKITLPFRLILDRDSFVMLNHDAKIYPCHLDWTRYDFSNPVAEVTQNPKNPTDWGLKNLSKEKWSVSAGDGSVTEVEPGRSAKLVVGKRINFGVGHGTITH